MVTDDGDQVYTRVLFMVFCQMSKSERSPEHPGKGLRVRSGPSWSHRVLGGRRSPRELGWDTQTQGRSASAFQKTGEKESAGMNGAAGEGCGRPPGVRGSPQVGGDSFHKARPALQTARARACRPPGERTDPSAGRCGAFSVRPESPGPESLICGAGLRLRRLSPA